MPASDCTSHARKERLVVMLRPSAPASSGPSASVGQKPKAPVAVKTDNKDTKVPAPASGGGVKPAAPGGAPVGGTGGTGGAKPGAPVAGAVIEPQVYEPMGLINDHVVTSAVRTVSVAGSYAK